MVEEVEQIAMRKIYKITYRDLFIDCVKYIEARHVLDAQEKFEKLFWLKRDVLKIEHEYDIG